MAEVLNRVIEKAIRGSAPGHKLLILIFLQLLDLKDKQVELMQLKKQLNYYQTLNFQ